MRINVIWDDSLPAAEAIIVDTLFTEPAMIDHGTAFLRREMFDRNDLSLAHVVTDTLQIPTDTIKVIEHTIGKTHYGIVAGFALTITADAAVDYNIDVEVIDE